MADRFPSIEDIDSGETEARGTTGFEGAGEGSFLDRERAVLGEDADQFGSAPDLTNNATVQEEDGDLLGGDDFGGEQRATTVPDGTNDFESSFPAIDTQNENVGPGGSITNTTMPFQQSSGYTNYNAASQDQETEPIRQWREKRDADLARRDEASAKKKAETVNTARQDIDSFYESYNRKTDKQKEQTTKEAEEFLKNREDTTAGGTAWERIAKLADLSGKGQGGGGAGSTKARMREMLMSLKNDKDAPGASGV